MQTFKYGLSAVGAAHLDWASALYTHEELHQYYELVLICHALVESYLDTHPEAAKRFCTPDYRYYDILKLASPKYDDKVREWSLENKRRREEYKESTKNWGIKFTGSP